MLQNEMKTNSEGNATLNGVSPKTNKQADIVKRLEELNKWNEEQKKILQQKQIIQRQKLGMEHKTMYEMLGLKSGSDTSLLEEELKSGKLEKLLCQENENHLEEYVDESTEDSIENSQIEEEEIVEDASQDNDIEHLKDTLGTRPKRSFLKRGEGLKQRFKIDPDDLRLNNLPKYKFANAHANLRLKPLNKSNKTTGIKSKTNMPKSKTVVDQLTNLDVHEQRFQSVLISSKNSCSSTPETKPTYVNNKNQAPASKNPLATLQKQDTRLATKLNDNNKSQPIPTPPVAWSKILDPLEIDPLQVPRINKQTLPQSEESIFELMEQKALEGSFDMESTCLKEFMTRRIAEKLNETDDNIPVREELKSKRLEPVASAKIMPQENSSSFSSDEVEEEVTQASEEVESASSCETTHKTIETTNSSVNQQTHQVRVRFSDSNETHEYDEDRETTTANDTSRLSGGSNQQESQNDLFVQFKQALFGALKLKADQHLANDSTLNTVSDTTLTDKNTTSASDNCDLNESIYTPACKDLQEKTEVIKMRLAELEKEVKFFKENNLLLLKAKQEHELQKSLNAQEHLEAMESLRDEKIRMEIYLHDERVKLEDEKHQFEQNVKMKTQGSIAKERKECERLKEQVHQLEMQLKTKDSNHTAAQARLRTQIRNLEREQNKLYEQIENLTKECKRLENENFKISREQNNKILLEINRNIAKLAPKQIQQSSTSALEDGPPTLSVSRTVSKSIVAAATANRNSAKPYKTKSTKFSNVQMQLNSKNSPTTTNDKETETPAETNFTEENKKYHQQQIHHMHLDDEEDDDDDILKEFEITPEKSGSNTSPTKTKTNNCNTSPQKSLTIGQNQVPGPPPSSPRSSGGMNMKREIVNADGSKDIWYPNGNLKKISPDGMVIRMLYYNKDIKETNINEGTVKYYYAESNTWHTSYLDGLEILEFPNGQIEHRHNNGIVEVHYPNNSVKIVNPKDENRQEEWRFADGSHLVQMRNGDKILSLPNGQKEIHNKLHKRREYPDGTVKIVYPDGSTETRYSNGRVRLKDKEGKLVMDTDM